MGSVERQVGRLRLRLLRFIEENEERNSGRIIKMIELPGMLHRNV